MDSELRGRAVNGARRVQRRLRSIGSRRTSPPDPRAGMEIMSRLSSEEKQLIEAVLPYTITGPERIIATADAVDYVVRRNVSGALIECGVWRGGSVLAMILRLQAAGIDDRDVYLFDTFEGMTEPTEHDTSDFHEPAAETWSRAKESGETPWPQFFGSAVFGLEQVRDLLGRTGYPEERIHYVVGPVEETLPAQAPPEIAVLRLDTDWYESTRHELVHLYPRMSVGGVLIVDDYGHWEGSRRAVEEYFTDVAPPILLHRTDYAGRVGVKY